MIKCAHTMRRFVSIRSVLAHLQCGSSLAITALTILYLVTTPTSAQEGTEEDILGLPRVDSAVDVQTLLHRAELGDARASFLLGTRYASGRAGVRDDSEAVRWFTQAAKAGLAEAQYNLGIMYASGRGVARNMTRAAHWYEQAAKQGVIEAQFNLGTLYGVGLGVEKNEQTAAGWLRRAADKGLSEAQYNLGVLYEHGRGVRLDGKAALHWYEQAAKKGYARASRCVAGKARKTATNPEVIASESMPSEEGVEVGASNQLRSNDWVAGLNPRRYTLQLMSQSAKSRAVHFIRERHLE